MPYARNDELPPSIRGYRPPKAQDIHREAFNDAWREYGTREPGRIEKIAHRRQAGDEPGGRRAVALSEPREQRI